MTSLKTIKEIVLIIIGTSIYAFGLVYLNIANQLAEGGVSGITLILKALFGIDPAYSTLFINIPLILIGGKILGKRSLAYTVLGTLSLSVFLWIWQRVPLQINLQHDLLIVSLLAGLVAGIGSGLVYRMGGTTGGSDIIARILEKNYGISMGRSLLALDVIVLLASLSYIDLKRMMYTLIVSYVFSRVIDSILDGGYAAKGILVVSNKNEEIAPLLMTGLERGVTFLSGEGGFSGQSKKIIYIVVSSSEITEVKRIIHDIDEKAFVSVINVHEVEGEGFTYLKPQTKLLKRL
ncbi:YitT family protein [Enterococcus durans]|uniref:YitT family protein n=1 Tax=Enterococcus durans TaxID=53345 RepID=A0A5N0YX93_9ENTE|nr:MULTISPECIES: YitT family protein [Enterococcus]KAA9178493.1 YitT family protein [Enterococcus durans]KAA9186950.1 YitT family protein [Enterococcus durans]KAA9187096.1 YitT family protein [Enterococcus durans]KAA9192933.1 YitT family protein [Enterococcus durans]KAA9195108.1 YitT family protein [Enterococcus durans]